MSHFTLLLTLLFIVTLPALAEELHRPKSFKYKTSKAVFVDFIEAHYDVILDAKPYSETEATVSSPLDHMGNKSLIKSHIVFDMPEAGHPVFDNYFKPRNLRIDGKSVLQKEIIPPDVQTELRVIESQVSAGRHVLEIETVPNGEFVTFDPNGGLKVFSVMGDNEPRGFLEYNMPASFEYDQVKMTMKFSLINTMKEFELFANGEVTKIDSFSFEINYPDYFTSSSPFFQIASKENIEEVSFTLQSLDGRTIPARAYYLKNCRDCSRAELLKVVAITKESFSKAEELLGPYPHPELLILSEGPGDSGMEYCGAMTGGTDSLNHELLHSWFARGAMPANGNAGWIDESVVTWIDQGDPKITSELKIEKFSGYSLPYYQRENGLDAYDGVPLLSYLHNVTLKSHGGLTPFLKEFFDKFKHKTYTTEEFIDEMSVFAGEDLAPLFKKYATKKYVPEKD